MVLPHLLVSGCVLLWPVDEFVPFTTGGEVYESHCLAVKSMKYKLDGAELSVGISGNGSQKYPHHLYFYMTPAVGQTVRVPVPEVRVQPLDGRPVRLHMITGWLDNDAEYDGQTGSMQRAAPTDPTAPMNGRVIKRTFNNRPFERRYSFSTRVMLEPPPTPGYRITLPGIEVDGKLHQLAPIEFRFRTRIEWFAPLNC